MEKILTDDEVEAIIRSYLPQVIHLSLGTCRDNKPWVCEVHYAFDDDLTLYFCSLPSRRHSEDIACNPQVSGTIVTQHFLGQAPRGVYFEGTAALIENATEQHPAVQVTSARLGKSVEQILRELGDGRRFYKIVPTDWYLFDTYVSRPPQKYHLSWPRR